MSCETPFCFACQFKGETLFKLRGLCLEQKQIDTDYIFMHHFIPSGELTFRGLLGWTNITLNKTSQAWEIVSHKFIENLGFNFINILCEAFTHTDPKSAKRYSSHQCLFTLLESLSVKAACKTLVKPTLGHVLGFHNGSIHFPLGLQLWTMAVDCTTIQRTRKEMQLKLSKVKKKLRNIDLIVDIFFLTAQYLTPFLLIMKFTSKRG